MDYNGDNEFNTKALENNEYRLYYTYIKKTNLLG